MTGPYQKGQYLERIIKIGVLQEQYEIISADQVNNLYKLKYLQSQEPWLIILETSQTLDLYYTIIKTPYGHTPWN